MRVAICLTLLMLTGLVQQEKPAQPAKPAPELYEDEEAYKVYVALLPQDMSPNGRNIKYPIIRQLTIYSEDEDTTRACIKLEKKSKPDWLEVLNDYVNRNKVPLLLARKFPYENPYELLTPEQETAAFKNESQDKDVWTAFYRRYPGSKGIVYLSAVGFNRSKDKAIVKTSQFCGFLCGGGHPYFLEKREGTWKLAEVSATICVGAS